MDVSAVNRADPTRGSGQQVPDQKMRAVARELEANFLAEMLKSAGVGETRQSFGGGTGEDQFSSFLVQEYANATVQAGGIGLAQTIYESLLRTKEPGS